MASGTWKFDQFGKFQQQHPRALSFSNHSISICLPFCCCKILVFPFIIVYAIAIECVLSIYTFNGEHSFIPDQIFRFTDRLVRKESTQLKWMDWFKSAITIHCIEICHLTFSLPACSQKRATFQRYACNRYKFSATQSFHTQHNIIIQYLHSYAF